MISPDVAWQDTNIGPYIYDTYGYDRSFVVNDLGKTTYASLRSHRTSEDAFVLFGKGLAELVAKVRRLPDGKGAKLSAIGSIDAST